MGNRVWIFFLVFFLGVVSCASQQPPETDFYEGLKEQRDGDQTKAIACFEKALYASNSSIASAAAAELMKLHSAGTELSSTVIITIRQVVDSAAGNAAGKIAGPWAKAFDAIETAEPAAGSTIDKPGGKEARFAKASFKEAIALLLDGENRLPDDAARYALRHWRSGSNADTDTVDFFTEAENAAIDGRLAVSRSRYNEALIFFRIALRDSPDLFFRYPGLLSDLGRTFQYAQTGLEGRDLFLEWEQNAAMFAAVPPGSENLVRFRLLFFAGRIARQRKEPHIALFERALPFAPEDQNDACIWYILDSAFAQGTDTAIRYLETYISRWQDDTYFTDIMDKLTRELVMRRQWNELLNVFALLQNRPFTARAQYAWIIGRAIEEGLFSPEGIIRANAMLPGKIVSPQESARAYMRIAYNTEKALYYRSLSAAVLGETFLPPMKIPETPIKSAPAAKSKNKSVKVSANSNGSDALRFLLGFFEHDVAEFAPRYIRLMESDLSPEELRRIAEALGNSGNYQESMRIVSLYTRQKDYQTQRRDWELLYPQPYRELVERYAKEAGIDPALLFGLIRTESAFNSGIVSHAGAIGLTQLMPATAQEFAVRLRRQGGPDYTDTAASATAADAAYLRDPAANIHIGAAYLAYLNERMGDPLLALLAYNGGMNRVRRWRNASSFPPDLFLETVEYPETREYGRSVMAAQAMYRGLYY